MARTRMEIRGMTREHCAGPSAQACCVFIHFFASRESAERYVRERPALQANILSMGEGIETGRAVFEGVLGTAS